MLAFFSFFLSSFLSFFSFFLSFPFPSFLSLPFLSFPFLSLPFLSFPFLSFPFLPSVLSFFLSFFLSFVLSFRLFVCLFVYLSFFLLLILFSSSFLSSFAFPSPSPYPSSCLCSLEVVLRYNSHSQGMVPLRIQKIAGKSLTLFSNYESKKLVREDSWGADVSWCDMDSLGNLGIPNGRVAK